MVHAIGDIILVIGIIWVVVGFLQYMQIVKMNNTLHKLGDIAPRVFRAANGKFFKLRLYVLAAANQGGMIKDARYFYTAFFFKPAKDVQATELIGQKIQNINVEDYKDDKVKYDALVALKEDYQKRKHLAPQERVNLRFNVKGQK